MKKFLVLTLISVFLCACSSETVTENKANNKVRVNSNSQNANIVQNANTIENINEIPVNATNSSADANLGLTNSPMDRRMKKVSNSATVSTEKPKITYVPGPNNSGIATQMGDKGEFIQVRVFNSDPQIKSIEQVVSTDKLKVLLKNGKVLEITVGKDFTSEKFVNISPEEILVLAGVKEKPDQSQTGSK